MFGPHGLVCGVKILSGFLSKLHRGYIYNSSVVILFNTICLLVYIAYSI